MVSRVLVAMDDSEMAERALGHALEVYPDAEITVLTVVGEPSRMMGEAARLALSGDTEATARELAEDVLSAARERAAESGTEVQARIRTGSPARAIVDEADDFDVVVLGSHSGGLAQRLLVGNVAEKVVRQSPVPVTVVR